MKNEDSIEPRQVERVAYSIPEFCVRNNISPAKYHALKRMGRGPEEMRDGLWVRVTQEAELAWQRAMTNPTDPKQIASRDASEAITKARGKIAGKFAAQSPKHVSKTRGRKAES